MTARPTAVVTGGGAGIGAAIARQLGDDGAHVVTLDPNVSLDGAGSSASEGPGTAECIVEAGGSAEAVDLSVTDWDGVDDLFDRLVAERGAVDVVVNVAGISRPTGFATGSEADWRAVLDVHLGGWLTVLGCALPRMAAAGSGRILGVTSGSGWRPADAGAYSTAKRAVAALTWQLGPVAPAGVTIDALSPIAATRMVTESMRGGAGPDDATTGGIVLTGFPPPDRLGPIGAHLATTPQGRGSGRVWFSAGAELALVAPPRPIEMVRTADVSDPASVLSTVVPEALVPAEQRQATLGAGSARFETLFAEAGSAAAAAGDCLVIGEGALAATVVETLANRARSVGTMAPPSSGFSEARARLQAAIPAGGDGHLTIALALDRSAPRRDGEAEPWRAVLDDHQGLTARLGDDAALFRAAADLSADTGRSLTVVILLPADGPGGVTRTQALAQLSRAAQSATGGSVSAVVVGIEDDTPGAGRGGAQMVAHLAAAPDDAAGLSGAELWSSAQWLELRTHPAPRGILDFGGPEVPSWLDHATARLVGDQSVPPA